MIKVFNSPFRVTQKFGINSDYYKQFGLTGHEGLDLVPTSSDWSVYSLPYKGKVVKDIDMASKGGAYGITDTIWYPEIGEAWQYCHLKTNTLYEGQEIDPGIYIGQMGDTGNTKGAHLHVNRFKVNVNGIRLNKDNGTLGGIDPLPFLEQEPKPDPNANLLPVITDQTRIPQIDNKEVQAIRSELQATHDRVGELDRQIATARENLLLANTKYDDLRRNSQTEYNALKTEYEAYKAQNPPLAGLSLLELIQLYLKKKQG